MGEILDALQGIYDFIKDFDGYSFVEDIFAQIIIWVGTWYIYAKIAAVKFFWGVAQSMLDQLNISSTLQYYWGQLDSGLLGLATRYRIPEAINLVLNAYIVRFLLSIF